FGAGFCFWAAVTPMGGWRSAERGRDVCEASVGPALSGGPGTWRGALRPHTGDARLPALAPWRFWAPGPRFPSPALRPDRSQRTPRIRVVVPGGGPLPPGATVASRRRGTPRLAPSSGSSLEHAPY